MLALGLHSVCLKILGNLWSEDTPFLVYYDLKNIKNGYGDKIGFLKNVFENYSMFLKMCQNFFKMSFQNDFL